MWLVWDEELDEDALTIGESEIEDLDNDELKANEAGFLQGYEYVEKEDHLDDD